MNEIVSNLLVYGSLPEDSILWQLADICEKLKDGTETKVVEDRKLPGTKFYYGSSHEKLIRKFYQSLETGSGDYIHVADAEMSIQLIDAIQNSGRFGIWVTV